MSSTRFFLEWQSVVTAKAPESPLPISNGFAAEVSDTFRGRLAYIGEQAISATGGSYASFEIKVDLFAMSPEQRKYVRLGMSANAAIICYQNDKAIVVPDTVIQVEDGKHFILLQDLAAKKLRRVEVKLGRASNSGVEVIDGLNEGDVVVQRF